MESEQLRQSLAGEALKTIENLDHSTTAYHTAKERLEGKFGGHHCQAALHLEEVDNFRPICPGNYKEIEKFADLLDVTILNLKKANHSEKRNNGWLYLELLKKLPTYILSSCHQWILEKQLYESVECLREWTGYCKKLNFKQRLEKLFMGLQIQDKEIQR